MRLQGDMDAAQHTRTMESIAQQHAMGVEVINVQAQAHVTAVEADAWLDAVQGTSKTVGIWLIDAWNGIIRPLSATWAIAMITISTYRMDWVMDLDAKAVCGAALGIYLADRTLFKRGK